VVVLVRFGKLAVLGQEVFALLRGFVGSRGVVGERGAVGRVKSAGVGSDD